MQKGYKEIKTWFSLYSSKYLWIFFSLFACLWGKHLARTSPRNPFSSAGALPLAKCSGIVNGCWWPGLCFWHHQWPLQGVPGWQVGWKQSTLHSHLNQWFDAPSSKCLVPHHLGKPSRFQVQKPSFPCILMTGQVIPDIWVIYQQNWGIGLAVFPQGQAMVVLRS